MTQHTDPCSQAAPIAAHTVAIESINKTLERMVEGQSEIVRLLQESAAQGERNRATDAQLTALAKNTEDLFRRMSAVEIKAEGSAVRLASICAAASVLGAGAVSLVVKLMGVG